jgi:hypothetical protein
MACWNHSESNNWTLWLWVPAYAGTTAALVAPPQPNHSAAVVSGSFLPSPYF